VQTKPKQLAVPGIDAELLGRRVIERNKPRLIELRSRIRIVPGLLRGITSCRSSRNTCEAPTPVAAIRPRTVCRTAEQKFPGLKSAAALSPCSSSCAFTRSLQSASPWIETDTDVSWLYRTLPAHSFQISLPAKCGHNNLTQHPQQLSSKRLLRHATVCPEQIENVQPRPAHCE